MSTPYTLFHLVTVMLQRRLPNLQPSMLLSKTSRTIFFYASVVEENAKQVELHQRLESKHFSLVSWP